MASTFPEHIIALAEAWLKKEDVREPLHDALVEYGFNRFVAFQHFLSLCRCVPGVGCSVIEHILHNTEVHEVYNVYRINDFMQVEYDNKEEMKRRGYL